MTKNRYITIMAIMLFSITPIQAQTKRALVIGWGQASFRVILQDGICDIGLIQYGQTNIYRLCQRDMDFFYRKWATFHCIPHIKG